MGENVRVLGLDLYNGSSSQLSLFRTVTRVTFPLLQRAAAGTRFNRSLEDLVVVDQKGIVRHIGGSGSADIATANAVIASLLMSKPAAGLSPASLSFGGALQVGESKAVQITIENTGTADLNVTGIESDISGLSVDRTTLTVPAGRQEPVQVTLTPVQAGALSGTLTLFTDDPDRKVILLPIDELTVRPAPLPAIALSEETLDFGEIEAARPAQRTITIRNEGEAPLNVTAIRSDLPDISISEEAFALPAGGSRALTVTITPTSEGTAAGTLEILSDDPDRMALKIPISATAVIISADPRADFDGSGKVDFPDFLRFARAFGGTDPTFDLNDGGRVDFADFLIFVASFGRPVD